MPDEVFEVGDRVFMSKGKHTGTIVKATIQFPFNASDAAGVLRYDIKLDDGATIMGIFHGIERAARKA